MSKEALIFIVDDQASDCEMIRDALETSGYKNTRITHTPGDFRQLFQRESPDFAIVDICIEKPMDGYQVLRWLKRLRPQAPSLALTGYSNDIFRAIIAGADGFITKGEMSALPDALEHIMTHGFFISTDNIRFFVNQIRENHESLMSIFGANLTPMEKRTISALKNGASRESASRQLGLKVSAIKYHINIILKKLNMNRMRHVLDRFGKFFI